MSTELDVAELAAVIYSECGVSIRYCDSQAIAKKLIELGWEKKGEENGITLRKMD